MLHRSFKAAKCKTALKLAISRIKLLKNKRDAQVKQMKRELAQLLESGQVQTARIRVEHVVREEKTMAAYDLIEIYCELIAARLPIIESQKNCPIDLKEAITGVIFASPRCSDVPELMDVRKLIASKYGKDFVTAAVELRPDCGVNRMLVEKLSAKSPDGPTKVKILSAIAKEHNVKWDPASFVENDIKSQEESRIRENTPGSYMIPPVQTQSGERTLEDVNHVKPPVRTPQVQTPPYHGDPEYPSTHIPSKHDEIGNKSNVHEHKEVISATEVRDDKLNTVGTLKSQTEPQTQEMDCRRLYPEGSNNSFGGQNWNMNFKDAASAAQAAAESAELASMAARAAAELSRQGEMAGQYAVGSLNSTTFGKRDEPPKQYTPSDSNHLSSKSDSRKFYSSSSEVHSVKSDRDKQENLVGPSESVKRRDGMDNAGNVINSASSNSGSAFVEENPFGHDAFQQTYTIDSYPDKNSFNPDNDALSYQTDVQRQYGRSDVDFVTELDHGSEPQKMNHVGHAAIRRQASGSSSHSQSSRLGDNRNDALQLSRDKIGNNAVNDLFVTDEGNGQGSFKEKGPNDNSFVKFDDSGSDDDDYETGSNSHASALGGGSSASQLESTNSSVNHKMVEIFTSESHFSLEQLSHPKFTENLSKSSVFSPQEESFDGAFDDSDGLSTGSEEDLHKSKLFDNVDHGVLIHEENASSKPTAHVYSEFQGSPSTKGKMDYNRKPQGNSSPGKLDELAKHPSSSLRIDSTVVHGDELGFDSVSKREPPGFDSTDRQLPETSEARLLGEPPSGNGMELNYGNGTLTGGLRNKGYSKPPYSKKILSKNSSSALNTSGEIEESSSGPSVCAGDLFHAPYTIETSKKDKNGELRSHSTYSDSDKEDFGDFKSLPKTSIGGQNTPTNKKVESGVGARSSSRASIFVGNDSESENSPRSINRDKKPYSQEVGTDMREVSSSRASLFGREHTELDLPEHTSEKRFHPVSGVSRRTRTAANSGRNLIVKDNDSPLAPASSDNSLRWKSSSSNDNKQNLPPQMNATSDHGSSEVHGSGKHSTLRRSHEPRSSHEERNISTAVKSPSSLPKIGKTRSAESSKSTDAGEVTPSKEKASHVHPKLPDYDSFAAHFQSLRRQ